MLTPAKIANRRAMLANWTPGDVVDVLPRDVTALLDAAEERGRLRAWLQLGGEHQPEMPEGFRDPVGLAAEHCQRALRGEPAPEVKP